MLIYQSLACLLGFEQCKMPELSPLELPACMIYKTQWPDGLWSVLHTVISFCCGLKCHLIPALVSALNLYRESDFDMQGGFSKIPHYSN